MGYQLKIDVSPVYDLLGSFMVYTTKKWIRNLDIGMNWLTEVESSLPADAHQSLIQAAQWPFEDYDVLYVWAIQRTKDEGITAFLDDLAHAKESTLFEAVRKYIPSLSYENAVRIRNQYVPLLHLWYENYFRHVESSITALIEEDASEKKSLLHKMDPEPLIEYASGGVVIEPNPSIREVVLFPTVHIRPINMYSFCEEMLLIQYPVDVAESNEEEPPKVLLRLTHALAEPDRLRLLRYVADEPKSLTDMIRDLNKPEEMLIHHLLMLRAAGLLRTHLTHGDVEKFSIRPDGAAELQMFLETYIHQ
ncbi:ArsR family transcriptional regulator [Paenibacillus sediminis]|uniref:DNA-binding transcriptional ArsR family regulator n=1 Tax=Paenibacillus sediminis TaxID=664909 RepID=A0ABS4H088_9BACL|nr:ArsR family transcriptional regulator [Paenibacillus sediminis]MBP1935938.1 DNA-binding transcriptional ArsR family regulator [Paenibacillus sediminis]